MSDSLRVEAADGKLRINVELPMGRGAAETVARVASGASGTPNVAPDCTAVVLSDGTRYTFTRKQRLVVAALLRAREDGRDYVSGETLLELAESDQVRLRDLFRGHPAWGSWILPGHADGGPLGTYRLAP